LYCKNISDLICIFEYLKKIAMNTKILLNSLIIASLFLTSCKKETPPQENSSNTEAVTEVVNDSTTAVALEPMQSNASGENPNTMMLSTPAANTNTNTVTAVTTAKGMNPPHGQSGHRCDIAVGAPLNTPVSQSTPKQATPIQIANTTATTSSVMMNSNSTPVTGSNPTVTTAEGMNPPHGQEGHRCDISVGAPLPKS
jgi:hypothetical protein